MYHLLNTMNLLAPGLLLAALVSSSRRRGRLVVTWTGLFTGLVASVCIVSVISLVLLELSVFRHRILEPVTGTVNFVLGASLAVAFARNRFTVSLEKLRPSRWLLAAGALMVAAMAVRVPVSRYIYGGQDQGTYVVMSRMFARTGRVAQHSEVLEKAHSDPKLRRLRKAYKHFRRGIGLEVEGRYEGAVYPGFYIADGQKGTIVPQFFHLHPVWMTIMGWLWGAQNGAWSVLLFAFLGLLGVWYLSKWALGDRWAGLLVLAFMGFQILQVWTARYPLSEIPAQGLVLAGLALLAGSLRTDDRASWVVAAVGGVSLGLSFFVRITAAFYGPPLVLFFLATPSARKAGGDRYRAFFYAAFLVMGWAAVHNFGLSYPYVYDLVRKRLGYRAKESVAEVALTVAGSIAALALFKEVIVEKLLGDPKERLIAFVRRNAPLIAVVAAAGVAAILVWKLGGLPVLRYRGGRPYRIMRAVQLAAFISWPALVLGFAGVAWLLGRKKAPNGVSALLGMLGLWFLPIVLLWPVYNRYAYYYCRYFVSDLIPFLFLGLSFLLVSLFRWGSRLAGRWSHSADPSQKTDPPPRTDPSPKTHTRNSDESAPRASNRSDSHPSNRPERELRDRPNHEISAAGHRRHDRDRHVTARGRPLVGRGLQAGSAVVGGLVLAFFLYGHFENPTYRRTELTGAWAAANRLAAQIPKNGLVLMSRRPPRKPSPGFHTMLGITLQFAYGYETLRPARIGKSWRILDRLDRPLFLFEESDDPRVDLIKRGYLTLQIAGGAAPFNHSQKTLRPPKKYNSNWYSYFIYRLQPADHYKLRPGQKRWKSNMEGFHAWEGRHSWTKSRFQINRLPVPFRKPVEVVINLRGIFPKSVDCPIKISVNGKLLHKKTYLGTQLKREKTIGPIEVPARLNYGRINLRAKTCAWRPSVVSNGSDGRPLGVDVQSIEVRVLKPERPGRKRQPNPEQD